MEIYWYLTENKTLLSSGRVVGKNSNIYGENVLSRLINSFYLTQISILFFL